jgi:hypothetical protein
MGVLSFYAALGGRTGSTQGLQLRGILIRPPADILFAASHAWHQMKTGAAPLLRERRLRFQTMPRIAAFKSKLRCR